MTPNFPSAADTTGRTLGDEEVAAVERVIRSGMLNSVWGTEAKALEREMAALYGARHAVACSSGTAALHLAVVAAAPDPGDEIVTTPVTDFGTVAPILAQNAVPVFADVDPLSGNLDPEAVRAAITPRTRAIMAVHLFGAPAALDELRAIADEHGLTLIEDCAQAWLGELPDGRPVGRIGEVGCFSLQQWKHITCGDGGLVITDDDAPAQAMRLFADKGWDRAGGRHHLSFGLNYRMTELQAAVARCQLAKLPGVVAARRRWALRLRAELAGLPGLALPDPRGHAWWYFPIVLPGGGAPELAAKLAADGIPVRSGYLAEPLNRAPLWDGPIYGTSRFPLSGPPADCPQAQRLIDETLLIVEVNENYTAGHVTAIADGFRRHVQVSGIDPS
ncbi:DegT/DnrJ/EryC1/StrS family aminotransferase [Rhizohabitans arisaemae]|uniref:DegT/DnrJ/EryC1/StrS family aminotransferase n=1 Tax=Rhizohabitans arisaemae TaxID=2720610 RepID=UPI0024B23BC4|nr:DegT/DnrJ/EryC1/StrS family aminotransferase [Rhizohabitans arisaemae]